MKRKHQTPPFSVQSYATTLRKTLLEGAPLSVLLDFNQQHTEVLEQYRSRINPSRLSPADRLAWSFIKNIQILKQDFVQEKPQYIDQYPWSKIYREFHLELYTHCEERPSQQLDRLIKWQKRLPSWFSEKRDAPNPQVEYPKKSTKSIRGFQCFLEAEAFSTLVKSYAYLKRLPWSRRTTFLFQSSAHTWKAKRTQMSQELVLEHALGLAPLYVLQELFHELEKIPTDHSFKEYLDSNPYCQLRKQLENPLVETPEGRGIHVDLDEIVMIVQDRWFPHMDSMPVVNWLPKFTTRKLAHYSPTKDEISFSLIFDSPRVSSDMLSYLAYHELLHRELGAQLVNGRRHSHTPEFKAKEQLFPRWQELEKQLSYYIR